ncbi:MAG: lipoate--protein ligase family protein [Candidatus Rokubacteria bacterium]|nr:lipoate--protein ligase family protein [Candidatus Rokubacteria bacterium]MBI2554322.1 lipoate--protein ligase family protein [Candidatus Rokubacteria bacterium]
MSGPVRLLDLGAAPPLRSQALYHGLAEAMDADSPDTIAILRPASPYFCVGYHQSPRAELDLAWCRENGYPVIQRRIGGGTVYLDADQLFYQCVFHRSRAPFDVASIYRRFLTPPVRALQALGLPATLEAINEIEVGGRRIAGTGGGQIGEAVVVVGNLLLDFPADIMARAWRVPSPEFRRLAEDGLRRHLATLCGTLGQRPSEEQIRRRLVRAYEESLGRSLVPGRLTRLEEAAVRREERKLARLDEAGHGAGRRQARLKVTHRVWVHEWTGRVGEEPGRVTARVADGRIEEMSVAGAVLDREEAERHIGQVRDRAQLDG